MLEERVFPPVYAGATGKLLLSQMSSPELSQLMDTIHLEKIAPNTITNRKALLKEKKVFAERICSKLQ
jgi:DNA-binding IclR family transcriptional regulator